MKIAACFNQDGAGCLEIVQKMLQALALRDFHQPRAFPVKNGAVGYVATSDQFSSIPLFRQSPSGNLLMVSGVPIDLHSPLDQTLHMISGQDFLSASQSLALLDGAFAALFWDGLQQKLAVVTDFLGMQPLYVVQRDGLLLLGTELKGITASGLVNLDLDPASWGCFLARGHLFGTRTFLAAVKRAEGGNILIYDPARGSLDISTYWRWPDRKPIRAVADVDTGLLVELLRRNIRGYTAHHAGGSVLLSGGFDSRLLLSLLQEEQISPKALIIEHSDELNNADGKFAVQAARLLHADYEVAKPLRTYYSSEAYLDYLIMNEVATPSLYLFIAQVMSHIRPQMRAIWDGVATGTTVNAYGQKPGGFKEYLATTPRTRDAGPWKIAARVFAPRLADEMFEAFSAVLDQETAKYPDDEYGVREFHIRSRNRTRMAPNPLLVYSNEVLPFTPGYEREFFNLAVNVPAHLKMERTLLLEVYRRHFRVAATVPFCSGAKLLNPWRQSDPLYYLTAARLAAIRLYENPYFRAVLRRVKRPPFSWEPSSLVARVISLVNPDHPDLNSAAVRLLQQGKGPADSTTRGAQETLFYWQVWRWVMDGTLTVRKKDAILPTRRPLT